MGTETRYQFRKPSFNIGGEVRAMRSRPGAPLADPTLNRGGTSTGLTSNWDSIFRTGAKGVNPDYKSSIPAVPSIGAAGPTAPTEPGMMGADEAQTLTNPSTQSAPITNFSGSTPTHAQRWGVPPPHRADDSMPDEPFMPKGPGVPFVMPKMTGTYDEMLAKNKDIAAPGGAQGFWQTPSPTGWQTTGADELASIQKRFGWKSAFR